MREYVDNLIQEAKARMKAEGSNNEEVFLQFIDDVIDEWLQDGKIHEDADIENFKDMARSQWEVIQAKLLEQGE
jgi:polyhydroxyalkanoate synthesis regulator phasin